MDFAVHTCKTPHWGWSATRHKHMQFCRSMLTETLLEKGLQLAQAQSSSKPTSPVYLTSQYSILATHQITQNIPPRVSITKGRPLESIMQTTNSNLKSAFPITLNFKLMKPHVESIRWGHFAKWNRLYATGWLTFKKYQHIWIFCVFTFVSFPLNFLNTL